MANETLKATGQDNASSTMGVVELNLVDYSLETMAMVEPDLVDHDMETLEQGPESCDDDGGEELPLKEITAYAGQLAMAARDVELPASICQMLTTTSCWDAAIFQHGDKLSSWHSSDDTSDAKLPIAGYN